MSMVFLAMVIGTIVEKVKKNRAHSVDRMTDEEWEQFCSLGKAHPEWAEKADSMSLDELEHLSDKKD